MLENFKHALTTWPLDSDSEKISLPQNQKYIISSILKKSKLIQSYLARMETNNPDDEELYDLVYTDSHFISGFGVIIECEKVHHLGQLAELIADLGRYFLSYNNYSMIYLNGLVLEKLNEVCEQLDNELKVNVDISDVVNECAIYLNEPLEHALESQRLGVRNGLILICQLTQYLLLKKLQILK